METGALLLIECWGREERGQVSIYAKLWLTARYNISAPPIQNNKWQKFEFGAVFRLVVLVESSWDVDALESDAKQCLNQIYRRLPIVSILTNTNTANYLKKEMLHVWKKHGC